MINAVYIEFKEKGTVIISKMSEGAITKLLDLTKDLIASTIIIGQGMPNKFSSFKTLSLKIFISFKLFEIFSFFS